MINTFENTADNSSVIALTNPKRGFAGITYSGRLDYTSSWRVVAPGYIRLSVLCRSVSGPDESPEALPGGVPVSHGQPVVGHGEAADLSAAEQAYPHGKARDLEQSVVLGLPDKSGPQLDTSLVDGKLGGKRPPSKLFVSGIGYKCESTAFVVEMEDETGNPVNLYRHPDELYYLEPITLINFKVRSPSSESKEDGKNPVVVLTPEEIAAIDIKVVAETKELLSKGPKKDRAGNYQPIKVPKTLSLRGCEKLLDFYQSTGREFRSLGRYYLQLESALMAHIKAEKASLNRQANSKPSPDGGGKPKDPRRGSGKNVPGGLPGTVKPEYPG